MLVSLRTAAEIDSWFENLQDVRGAIHYAHGKVLLVSEDSTESLRLALLQAGKEALSERDLDLLAAFIGSTPAAKCTAEAPVDFHLIAGAAEGLTLSKLEREDLIAPISKKRKEEIFVGESLDSVLDRKLRPFLPFCSSLTLVDPYAGKAIFDKANTQFLDKLSGNQKFDIEIHTTVPQGRPPNATEAAKLTSSIASLFSAIEGFAGCVTTHVYRSNTAKFHNRRLGLNFRGGGLYFMLENSISNLSKDAFSEAQNFSPITPEAFQKHLIGVRQGLQHLHSDKVTI